MACLVCTSATRERELTRLAPFLLVTLPVPGCAASCLDFSAVQHSINEPSSIATDVFTKGMKNHQDASELVLVGVVGEDLQRL